LKLSALPPLLVFVTFFACEQPRTSSGGKAENERAPLVVVPPGSVEGLVRLVGPAPQYPPFTLSPTVERECGKQLPDLSLVVGAAGALEGVVVSIDAKPAPGGPEQVVVDQRKCAFVPVVSAARAGGQVVIRNSDPLIHNVRADLGERQLFNIGMPLEGMTSKKPLPPAPSIVDLRCDIHTWMHAWVKTFDHPYFTVSAADGRFRLQQVPAGKQRLVFWHPRLGERTLDVEVSSGKTVTQDLAWPTSATAP
jgi:hypothetical protein